MREPEGELPPNERGPALTYLVIAVFQPFGHKSSRGNESGDDR